MPICHSAARSQATNRAFARPVNALKLLTLVAALLFISACSESKKSALPTTADLKDDRQTAFRVRSNFSAPLNEDSGWASNINESATVLADEPFRIRFEVEAAETVATERRYQLQVRRNNGPWEPLGAENFPQPTKELDVQLKPESGELMANIWQVVSGDATAVSWQEADSGYLTLQSAGEAILAVGRYETSWTPIEFAVDLRLPDTEKARAGVAFGYENADNFLRVDVIAGVGVEVIRVSEGRESIIATHPFDIKTQAWFELKLIMQGRELIVEYDDEALVFTENLKQDIPPSVAGLYVPEGGRMDVEALAVEGLPRSPRTSIMASKSFAQGAQTNDLLKGSAQPFTGGAGISFAGTTPAWSPNGGHSEWEIPLVIRRFSDEAALSEPDDQFDYRLVDESGTPLAADTLASVTLDVAHGHLGGTFVETPMRVGPWEASNGDLYFLMEPAETWNALMTVKSADGGKSWREMDAEHRPETGDLEGVASVLVDDEIHMLHQTSYDVWYHVFRTSDHPDAPDTWAIQDERLASPIEPPTQVADLAVRSDGSVIAVYGGPEKIHYRTRSPQGEWSEETIIDANNGPNLSGPALVLGKNDIAHLAYTGIDGSAWYRRLLPNGDLTPRVQLATGLGTGSEDIGAILPLVYLPESDSLSIIYRLATGQLWERRVNSAGDLSEPLQVAERSVVQNAVDADQTGADAIAYGNTVHVLFIEEETGRLFHTFRADDGDWTTPTLQVDSAQVQWVRGALLKQKADGAVYGFVYDAGADGGSGMNKYKEVALPIR